MTAAKDFLEATSNPDVVGIKPFLPELWADDAAKIFAAKIDADILDAFYGPRPLSVEDSYNNESYAEAIAWALTLGIDVTLLPRQRAGKKQKILLSVRHAPDSIHEHAFKQCSPAELIDRLRAFATEIAND